MNFCSRCGSGRIAQRIPEGDNRRRHVCEDCGAIFYQNPKIVAGCLPQWEDRVLLCRRAIEPRRGLWTLPAGFMENAETTEQAAMRETFEEANARVRDLSLYSVFSLPHIDQVYLLFRATLSDLDFRAGDESLDVQLFREEEIPWDALAFATIRETLRHYFEDRRQGRYRLHVGTITRSPAAS